MRVINSVIMIQNKEMGGTAKKETMEGEVFEDHGQGARHTSSWSLIRH